MTLLQMFFTIVSKIPRWKSCLHFCQAWLCKAKRQPQLNMLVHSVGEIRFLVSKKYVCATCLQDPFMCYTWPTWQTAKTSAPLEEAINTLFWVHKDGIGKGHHCPSSSCSGISWSHAIPIRKDFQHWTDVIYSCMEKCISLLLDLKVRHWENSLTVTLLSLAPSLLEEGSLTDTISAF